MFGGGTTNPYDDIVGKTTDENLTSENWELIMNLCDKVVDEGQEGARNVIAAILKRLAHRNPNVQLYALSLAESLSKNCGVEMNREIASKAFTQGLEKLVTDRNTHDKVKKRVLALVAMWTADFENDTSLGVMEDCYNTLKGKGFKFETPQEPLPLTVDDEIRRKEEEELQRVLELSMQDKGGRGQWSQYSLAASSGSSSTPPPAQPAATPSIKHNPPSRSASLAQQHKSQAPAYQGGYVPAKTPSPSPPPSVHQHRQHRHHSPPQPQRQSSNYEQSPAVTPQTSSTGSLTTTVTSSSVDTTSSASSSIASTVTRVRALHTFEPTEPGELPFEKGDIIRVVDRGYKDWWRGQLKGRTGIFPVNYVEPMPEPTAADMAKETEQEAAVFSQAVNVEKLLNMLRNFDPQADNLADNEEIQELYRSCMALRPKIVKLIDKYSQKRAELVSMNETFIRARSIFDQMMEESLARHTASIYDSAAYRPYVPPAADPRARVASPPNVPPGPQSFGWNPAVYDQPGYNMYPVVPAATPHIQHDPSVGVSYSTAAAAPTIAAGPTHADSAPQYGYVSAQGGYHGSYSTAPYPTQGPAPASYAATPGPQPTTQQTAAHQQPQAQAQPQPQVYRQDYQQQPAHAYSPQVQTQAAPVQAAQTQHVPVQQYSNQPQQQQAQQLSPDGQLSAHAQIHAQPQQQHLTVDTATVGQVQQSVQPQPQPQSQQQQQPQPQSQQQPQPQQQQQQQQQQQVPQEQGQPQGQAGVQGGLAQSHETQAQVAHVSQSDSTTASQSQSQPQPQQQTGPPYAFDPYTTYADPNVQAWAQYYAQGGKDPAGAVYFFSVPGVTDGAGPQLQPQPQQDQQDQQQQQQQHGQQGQGGRQQQQQGQDQLGYQQTQADAGSTTSLTADGTTISVEAATASPTSSSGHVHPEQYPTPASNRQPRIVSQASYSSLASAASGVQGSQQQPSWVLPRRATSVSSPTPQASAAVAASIPGVYAAMDLGAGAATTQPYHVLSNQFAGMSVAEHQ